LLKIKEFRRKHPGLYDDVVDASAPKKKFKIIESETTENVEQKIGREINLSLEKIRKSGLFDPEFLDNLVLISFGDEKTFKFQEGKNKEISKGEFNALEFMQGKRTDFVGINPRDEFEKYDTAELSDRQFLPFIFAEGKLTYNEFVAHEIAHNLFDRLYIQNIGQYEEKDDITDVSEDYRNKIKSLIIPLVEKNFPNIDIGRFSFNRQQIAEIFGMLYEREYCQRANENSEMHNRIGENIQKFAQNPEKILAEFNKEHNRNCTMDDFYTENHMLSLIISPLLEREYPEWKDRINLFGK